MLTLRPYQNRAADFLASSGLALCVCPAGGGKTVIAAEALRRATDGLDRIAWLANTREQVDQAHKALNAAGVKADLVACVAGVSTEQIRSMDFVVFDESHHLIAARTWQVLFIAAKDATIWGLTATPNTGDPDKDEFFRKLWKHKIFTVQRSEVMAGGHLADGIVRMITVDTQGQYDAEITRLTTQRVLEDHANFQRYKFEIAQVLASGDFASAQAIGLVQRMSQHLGDRFDESVKRHRWRQTLKIILESEPRNRMAAHLAIEQMALGKSIIVLVGKIEQGKHLCELIPGSVMVQSKMPKKARAEAMDKMRSGDLRCMVATSLADEGLDIPRASVLIYATFGRSIRLVEQRAGRVMRTHESKDFGLIYDFTDIGASMARSQSAARVRMYRKLGYRIEK